MKVEEAVANKLILFGQIVAIQARLYFRQYRCWLGIVPKTSDDFSRNAIVLQCPGLDCELNATTGTNPRVGGPNSPACIDQATVTGTLVASPIPGFEAMLKEITSIIVIGYGEREIPIKLIDIDKPRPEELQRHEDSSPEEREKWITEIKRRRQLW
jgi:hypothetical protein